ELDQLGTGLYGARERTRRRPNAIYIEYTPANTRPLFNSRTASPRAARGILLRGLQVRGGSLSPYIRAGHYLMTITFEYAVPLRHSFGSHLPDYFRIGMPIP